MHLRNYCRRNEGWLWLVLIMLIATAIRLNGLTNESYWFDELFSAYYSNPSHSFREVVTLTMADVHPPLYQLLMWWSYKLFGYNEFAGRLPSVIAGVATIPVIYGLGRELFSKRVGLYAAALAIPNYYLVYYAQEARSYAFLYFLCSLSFLFFIRALRSESKKNVLLYVCSTIAFIYTHYYAFIAAAAQGLILLVYMAYERRLDRRLIARAAAAAVLLLLASLPLVPSIVGHSDIGNFWIQQPEPWFIVRFFNQYFAAVELAGVFAVLLLTGAGSMAVTAKNSSERFAISALIVWLGVGYLLPWLRGLYAQPILTDRNTIMLVPPILLLAALGLTQLKLLWLQRMAGVILLCYSLWHLLAVVDYDDRIRKNQYREITWSLDAFDPTLPVYALPYNDTKFNVYFEQHQSALRAQDISILADKLAGGTAEALFWIADGFIQLMQTDLDEQYGLTEVNRHRFTGTMAVLFVNPAASKPLPLIPQGQSADGAGIYAAEKFVLEPGNSILVSVDGRIAADVVKSFTLELLDEQDNSLAAAAPELTGMNTAFEFKPAVSGPQAAGLRIISPAQLGTPRAWLLSNMSAPQN